MSHSWCNVRLSRTIMYFPGAHTWQSETRSLPRSQVSNYDVMKWYLDTVQRAENKLWDQGKQIVGFQRNHPISPSLAELLIGILSGAWWRKPECRFALFPWEKGGCRELCNPWGGESFWRSIPKELHGKTNSTSLASAGLSTLLLALKIGPRVHDWSSGWVGGRGSEGGQVGGGGHLGERTNTRTLVWMVMIAEKGSVSVQQHEESSQKEVYTSLVICAWEVLELEPPTSGKGVLSQICTPK